MRCWSNTSHINWWHLLTPFKSSLVTSHLPLTVTSCHSGQQISLLIYTHAKSVSRYRSLSTDSVLSLVALTGSSVCNKRTGATLFLTKCPRTVCKNTALVFSQLNGGLLCPKQMFRSMHRLNAWLIRFETAWPLSRHLMLHLSEIGKGVRISDPWAKLKMCLCFKESLKQKAKSVLYCYALLLWNVLNG